MVRRLGIPQQKILADVIYYWGNQGVRATPYYGEEMLGLSYQGISYANVGASFYKEESQGGFLTFTFPYYNLPDAGMTIVQA